MSNKNKSYLYEKYHNDRKLEKRLIYDYDFTHKPLIRVIKNRLKRYSNALDVGCGTGTACFYLASKGIVTTGVDISKNAIRLAKINAKNLGLTHNTNFYNLDFPKINITDKFDLIICSEVLEHIEDDFGSILKLKSLLKKDGELFLSVPLKSSAMYKNNLLNSFDKEVGHLRRYDDSKLLNLIKKARLKVIDVRKNQGVLREYLFTSTRKSLIVALANKYKIMSDIINYIDEKLFVFGVSNMTVLVKSA